jgi:putative oxidoreductase
MLYLDSPGYISLSGRILLSAIFLLSGINKFLNPQATQQYMADHGMGATGFFLICAMLIEVGAGLSLAFGFWTRTAALLLTLFMIPTTLIFHTNFEDPMQIIQFLKNVAMTGGLLYVYAYGPGPISVDARLAFPEPDETLEERESYRRTG